MSLYSFLALRFHKIFLQQHHQVVNVLHAALLLTHSQPHSYHPPALIKLFALPEKKLHEETDLHDLLGKKIILQLDKFLIRFVWLQTYKQLCLCN